MYSFMLVWWGLDVFGRLVTVGGTYYIDLLCGDVWSACGGVGILVGFDVMTYLFHHQQRTGLNTQQNTLSDSVVLLEFSRPYQKVTRVFSTRHTKSISVCSHFARQGKLALSRSAVLRFAGFVYLAHLDWTRLVLLFCALWQIQSIKGRLWGGSLAILNEGVVWSSTSLKDPGLEL